MDKIARELVKVANDLVGGKSRQGALKRQEMLKTIIYYGKEYGHGVIAEREAKKILRDIEGGMADYFYDTVKSYFQG